jgi:hypothetical protein
LKLKSDEPLSNFAFSFNLRRFTWAAIQQAMASFLPPDCVHFGKEVASL